MARMIASAAPTILPETGTAPVGVTRLRPLRVSDYAAPVAKPVRVSSSGKRDGLSGGGQPWQPWRPKHRKGPDAPETSADLMGEVLARLGGQGRALEFRVFDCYTRVVGDMLRDRTTPDRLAGKTLFVRVSSSALAHEVTLLRGEILAKIAVELGPGAVTELRTRVG
jgi:hypothetical protein